MSPSKKNSRVALRLFVVFFALAVFSLPFIPASTSAADESPSQIGKAWQAGIALGNCAESDGFNESRSASDLDNGEWYYEGVIGGSRKNVGFLTEPSDGQIRCESGSDIKILLGHLGTDGRTLLRETGIYALNGGTYERKLNGAAAQAKIKEWVQNKFGFNYNNGLSNATKYALLHAAFEECNQGEDPGGVSVKEIDNEGNEETNKYVVDGNKKVRVGYSLGGDSNMELTCSKIVSDLNSFAGDYAARVKELGGVNDGTGAATETEPSCESEGGAMSWLMCPAINAIDSALQFVDAQIQGLLEVDSNYYANDNIKNVFSNIRNIAFVILVPISLVMVLGTVMGFDFISAYTVKRAFPRLVIAIIFISLSYQICFLLISFFNELGSAVLGIISAPFGDANSLRLTTMFAGGILEGIASGIVGIVGIVLVAWLFGGTILLFSAVAFLVLLLRQMFIVVLMLAAPLAILAWIFPGNDKLWKLWWGSFSKLLMMYPIIMALIAMGRIFAYTIDSSNAAGIDGAVIQPIMTLVAYTIPYALIPFTFKLAGGMFATVAGMANDRSKGLFDRQRKSRERKLERTSQGKMFRNPNLETRRGRMMDRLNTAGAVATNAGKMGVNPRNWQGRAAKLIRDNSILGREAMLKDEEFTWAGNDTLAAFAALSENEAQLRAIAAQNGYNLTEDQVADVETMRRKYGNSAMRQAAWRRAVAGGTVFDRPDAGNPDAIGNMSAWHAAAIVSGGNGAVLSDLVGVGRGEMNSAGRYDEGGAGFGDTQGIAQGFLDHRLVDDNGNLTLRGEAQQRGVSMDQVARERLTRRVFEQQGGGVLTHPSVKDYAVEQIMPHAVAQVAEGVNSGDSTEFSRTLADAMAIYDTSGAGSPRKRRIMQEQLTSQEIDIASLTPEMKRIVGDALIQTNPDGTVSSRTTGTITLYQAMEAARSSDQAGLFMRQLQASKQQIQAQQAQMTMQQAAAQQQAQPQIQQPPIQPPQQPPIPPVGGSDRRIKRNISYLYTTDKGVNVYRFQYLWSNTEYIGVIAQELIDTFPEALSRDQNGFYVVDYSKIDVNMMTFEEWKHKTRVSTK